MVKPKTVDNLGIDVHTQYAQTEALRDAKSIREARAIPSQTEVDVTTPSFPNEFDTLLETRKRNQPWAEFQAPAKYHEQRKRLFASYQIIPSLGSSDKREIQAQRVSDVVTAAKQRESQRGEAPAESKEIGEEEKEKTIILNLFNRISYIEKAQFDIINQRDRYHKG